MVFQKGHKINEGRIWPDESLKKLRESISIGMEKFYQTEKGIQKKKKQSKFMKENNPMNKLEAREKLKGKPHWTKSGKYTKEEIKEKLGNHKKGKTHEQIYGKEQSKKLKLEDGKRKRGYKHKEKSKEKNRQSQLKRIEEGKIKKTNAIPEQKFKRYLDKKGIKYIHQYRIYPYIVDFYIPTTNTIYEVHGDYWHCNPEIYDKPKTEGQKKNIKSDKKKLKYFKQKGFNIKIIWQKDIEEKNIKI